MPPSRLTLPSAVLLILSLAACQAPPSGQPRLSPLLRGQREQQEPPAPPPPPTALPGQTGLPGTRLVWEWEEDARPSALDSDEERLAVIVSDGRFLWLDAATGESQIGGFIWPDDMRGETWGSVSIQGDLALVTAVETFQSALGDFPETRSRVVAFDAQGKEVWSLPELEDKHLYSASTGQELALVGTHRGFAENSLTAYRMTTGQTVWRYTADDYGFERVVADDARVYATLVNVEGGGVAAYDLDTGALLWAAYDAAVRLSDDVLLEGERLYVLTQPGAVALDRNSGEISWQAVVGLAPEAGMVVHDPLLYVVPAPTAGLSNRPGVLGINTHDGSIAWHALAGLVADPLAASSDALWAVVKDLDGVTVSLSVLEADTGLERARLPLSTDLEEHYSLVADGDTVYVLGDSLRAYRIPRQ